MAALDAAAHTHQEGNHRADQENDEKYFRDAGGADRDSTESKNCGNQGNDEEDSGIMKHDRTSCGEQVYVSNGIRLSEVSWNSIGGAVGSGCRYL